MIIYYVINQVGTHKYYNHDGFYEWIEIEGATKYEQKEFAFGVMKQYCHKFKFPCKIEEIYHLK